MPRIVHIPPSHRDDEVWVRLPRESMIIDSQPPPMYFIIGNDDKNLRETVVNFLYSLSLIV